MLNLEKDVRAMEAAPRAAFAKFERRGEKFITLVWNPVKEVQKKNKINIFNTNKKEKLPTGVPVMLFRITSRGSKIVICHVVSKCMLKEGKTTF